MEEKELNLCELLKGCEGEEFYTLVHGEVYLTEINSNAGFPISIRTPSGLFCLTKDGKCYNTKYCLNVFFPSRALYEKYPHDAYSAWMEWRSARTPKRWRAKKYQGYYYIDFIGGRLVTLYNTDEYDKDENNRYDSYNYFRTEELAYQAAKAVRECLIKFHEQEINPNKP